LAGAVRDTPRRRKILFFIGSDLRVQAGGVSRGGVAPDGGCELPLRKAREAMFAALTRANVTVHSLDPRGLENVSPATRTSSTLRAGEVQAAQMSSMTEHLRRQNALAVLPDLTGGRTIVNTNAPDAVVPGIFHESDSYYLLAFRASGDRSAPGVHDIAVKVKRDGLRVHARNGYTVEASVERAPSDELSPRLRNVLEPLLPAAAIPLELQAATFAVPGSPRAAVVLVVGLDAAVGASNRESQDAPFELVSFAIDPAGRSRAMARSTVAMTLAGDIGRRQHVDLFSGFELRTGDYEIRVAGGDGTRSASVFTHVTVPRFASEPLSLSGILLGEIGSAPEQAKTLVGGLAFPVMPTARREFDGERRISAFVRIYQGTGRTDALQPVTLRTFLVDDNGKTVSSASSVLAERQFNRDRASDQLVALPVSGLAPGEYLLSIEASRGERATGRAVRFTVKRP
jgi:hypothetical protein